MPRSFDAPLFALTLAFASAFALSPSPARAAKTSKPAHATSAPPAAAAATTSTATSTAEDRVVWDAWYTVTVGGATHYQYYHDHVEIKKGRIFFQEQAWKKDGEYINEESLGAFSENTPDLKPLFFNFRSTYRATETMIDGTASDDRMLSVRIRQDGKEKPVIRRSVPAGTIFSSFFPIWLKAHMGELKPGKSLSFRSVIEDNADLGFEPVSGTVVLERAGDTKSPGTRKLRVEYRGLKSVWWLNDEGIAERIELPQQDAVVEQVSREKAESFLRTK